MKRDDPSEKRPGRRIARGPGKRLGDAKRVSRPGPSQSPTAEAGGALSSVELRMGWVFFALHLFLSPFLVGEVGRVLDERLGIALTAAQSSAAYYALTLAVFAAAFWEFFRHGAETLRKDPHPALFAFAVSLAAGVAATCLAGLVPLPVANPVRTDYPQQFALSPLATALVVVVLRPAVEEPLFRGLLFGAVRGRSRAAAYVLSAGVFALAAVWQYVFPGGDLSFLLLALQYLPMGLALAWAYDFTGSIYVPFAARAAMNGIFLALALKGW